MFQILKKRVLDNRDRTSDLRNYSPPLYQLSYIEGKPPMRFELMTLSLQRIRSNQLSYRGLNMHEVGFEPTRAYAHQNLSLAP